MCTGATRRCETEDDDDLRDGVRSLQQRWAARTGVDAVGDAGDEIIENETDYSGVRGFHGGVVEEDPSFHELRELLINHLHMNKNNVLWNF